MGPAGDEDITQLLARWGDGDQSALERLTPLVYAELHQLADAYLRRERGNHTLQPTALIHEAYLRLARQNSQSWQNRSHFYGVAAHLMRLILVDHARNHRAAKRGSGAQPISIESALCVDADHTEEFLALEEAMTALAQFDERKSRIIELRYFGGLSPEEIAGHLGMSAPNVYRELRLAKAWLRKSLSAA